MGCQSTAARRRFLQTAGSALLLAPRTVFGSQANSTVEVGLVGCGGRGNWIAPFFPEHAGARVVALADVIKSRLDATREKLQVDSGPRLLGTGGLPGTGGIEARCGGDRDTDLLPSGARRGGRGCRQARLLRQTGGGGRSRQPELSGERAEGTQSKGLSFWVDFQSRARPVFQEAVTPHGAGRHWEDRHGPGLLLCQPAVGGPLHSRHGARA
jgi:myo-inositol 2-dehydrogenase/D-chiro-inositol 1-dehydrogenase